MSPPVRHRARHETLSTEREQTLKSYYEVPVEILEDAEQLTTWANQAGLASLSQATYRTEFPPASTHPLPGATEPWALRTVLHLPDGEEVATALLKILSEVDRLKARQGPREFVRVADLIQDRDDSSLVPVGLQRVD